jgi:energy-coupling factor transporter ATP-binding protein EcfA2
MIRPLTELIVKRLEQIFDPPGLPLVTKTSPDLATTSILIRGGPGSGKTTLAVALGHAIAAAGGGHLVYLTTEISPAEIRFKSDFLRIFAAGAALGPFPADRASARPAPPGSIFVQPFSGTAAADIEPPLTVSHEKKLSILEAAWDLLDIADIDAPPDLAGHPVRALVIDALILPDHGRDDSELRADLGDFLKNLELAGITPILIEETTTTAPSWLSFVVDLVFQLTHQDDPQRGPERGQLERTLTCTKSRYGFVSAGPHVYALSDRSPALFPALRHAANLPKIPNPLRFVLKPNQYGWLHIIVGALLINADAYTDLDILKDIPGQKRIRVSLDYPFKIHPPEGTPLLLAESHDPTMLTWRILDAAAQHQANTILIVDAERLLCREPWPQELERILLLLRSLGFIAVLTGDTEGIKRVGPIFDLSIEQIETDEHSPPSDDVKYHPSFTKRTTPLQRPYRPTVSTFEGIRWAAQSSPNNDESFRRLVASIPQGPPRPGTLAHRALAALPTGSQ